MVEGWVIAWVLAVIFLATLIRSAFGFGEALVAVPLLSLRIPVEVAAPVAVLVSIMVAAAIVLEDWHKVRLGGARAAGVASASPARSTSPSAAPSPPCPSRGPKPASASSSCPPSTPTTCY